MTYPLSTEQVETAHRLIEQLHKHAEGLKDETDPAERQALWGKYIAVHEQVLRVLPPDTASPST